MSNALKMVTTVETNFTLADFFSIYLNLYDQDSKYQLVLSNREVKDHYVNMFPLILNTRNLG